MIGFALFSLPPFLPPSFPSIQVNPQRSFLNQSTTSYKYSVGNKRIISVRPDTVATTTTTAPPKTNAHTSFSRPMPVARDVAVVLVARSNADTDYHRRGNNSVDVPHPPADVSIYDYPVTQDEARSKRPRNGSHLDGSHLDASSNTSSSRTMEEQVLLTLVNHHLAISLYLKHLCILN